MISHKACLEKKEKVKNVNWAFFTSSYAGQSALVDSTVERCRVSC